MVDGGLTIQLQENIGVHLGQWIQQHVDTTLPGENAAMPIQRFDFRTDLTNVAVSPPIRNRFRRVALGPVPEVHSHDLGGETFLVMEGQIEFTVADETVVCTAGSRHLRPAAHDTRGARNR